jgi:hypothetical protein
LLHLPFEGRGVNGLELVTEHRPPQAFEPLRLGPPGPDDADEPNGPATSSWLAPERLRRLGPWVLGLLLVLALLVLGALRPFREWVHSQPVYHWTLDDVEFDPEPPPWIRGGRAGLLAQVRGNLERFEGTSVLDLDLEAVTRAFKHLVWVERVRQVRRTPPNRLVVTLEYRTPVASARFEARSPSTTRPVPRGFVFDPSAILLPVERKRSAMKPRKSAGAITDSSSCFALRQNGSFSSLKICCIMCRLLPR